MPRTHRTIAIVLWSVVVSAGASQTATASSAHEIDRDIWSVFVATVAADDIVGMGRAYFPERCWSRPRGPDLSRRRWRDGDVTWSPRKRGATKPPWRFASLAVKTTARRRSKPASSNTPSSPSLAQVHPKFYPFEELLVKTNGKWRVLMERQFDQ